MNIAIVDLDGCISDDRWRRGLIRPPDYDAYHQLSGFDAACNRDIFLCKDYEIAIFTARPFFYRTLTREWLKRQGVPFRWLYMRHDGVLDHSAILKDAFLRHFLRNHKKGGQIVAAFDDRADVLKMYAKYGIPTYLREVEDEH